MTRVPPRITSECTLALGFGGGGLGLLLASRAVDIEVRTFWSKVGSKADGAPRVSSTPPPRPPRPVSAKVLGTVRTLANFFRSARALVILAYVWATGCAP